MAPLPSLTPARIMRRTLALPPCRSMDGRPCTWLLPTATLTWCGCCWRQGPTRRRPARWGGPGRLRGAGCNGRDKGRGKGTCLLAVGEEGPGPKGAGAGHGCSAVPHTAPANGNGAQPPLRPRRVTRAAFICALRWPPLPALHISGITQAMCPPCKANISHCWPPAGVAEQ